MDPDNNDEVLRAEVTERMATVDGETELFLVKVGDADEVMTYNAVLEGLNRQLEKESGQTPEEQYWIFKEVLAHRKVGVEDMARERLEDSN